MRGKVPARAAIPGCGAVHATNNAADRPLVRRTAGGLSGGGTVLTAEEAKRAGGNAPYRANTGGFESALRDNLGT